MFVFVNYLGQLHDFGMKQNVFNVRVKKLKGRKSGKIAIFIARIGPDLPTKSQKKYSINSWNKTF